MTPPSVPTAEDCGVLAGKLKQFAEECLRRYEINPYYCAEIMHTKDVYRDIIRVCESREAAYKAGLAAGLESAAQRVGFCDWTYGGGTFVSGHAKHRGQVLFS